MSIPDLMNLPNFFIPAPPGVKELNLGDEWRATWEADPELPEGIPVLYGYAIVVCEGKGYIARREGDLRWRSVEGASQAGEKPLAFAKRAAKEQAGATSIERVEQMGYYMCRATSHNPNFPPGATTARPIYLVVAKKVADTMRGTGFERRRLPMNEFADALRGAYPEFAESITKAVDRYMVIQAGRA